MLLPPGDKSVARPVQLHKIHFKFNQGFSNAVRRNVTINEFM
jgi:hypothetical protein